MAKKYYMREVRITYSNGVVIETNINGTNKEIKDYYKIGQVVNIGNGEKDRLTRIKKVEILD